MLRELGAIRPDIPVQLTLGERESEAERRMTARRDTAFLHRPFTPNDLVARLEAILPAPGR